MSSEYTQFYEHPDRYIPIGEMGDFYLRCFFDRYAGMRLAKNMSLFDRAYSLLGERGNFSRKKAFGEMHADGYLWIEAHPIIKVLVEERQSHKLIFIKDGDYSFHIRELQYSAVYPAYNKARLHGITVEKFREQGFRPHCPKDVNAPRFGAFTYGDERDEGYVLSMKYGIPGFERIDHANQRSLYIIDSMKFWEVYLDDPDELE